VSKERILSITNRLDVSIWHFHSSKSRWDSRCYWLSRRAINL